jgi:hypothetical protein
VVVFLWVELAGDNQRRKRSERNSMVVLVGKDVDIDAESAVRIGALKVERNSEKRGGT